MLSASLPVRCFWYTASSTPCALPRDAVDKYNMSMLSASLLTPPSATLLCSVSCRAAQTVLKHSTAFKVRFSCAWLIATFYFAACTGIVDTLQPLTCLHRVYMTRTLNCVRQRTCSIKCQDSHKSMATQWTVDITACRALPVVEQISRRLYVR